MTVSSSVALRNAVLGIAVLALPLLFTSPASAVYPEKPVRVVVPFAPGGVTDLTARAFQKAIGDHQLLSKPVVVVNVTGGAVGSVGSRQVLGSPPDGYTFLLHHLGMMSAGAVGTQDFSYRDFEPVAGTTDFCHVVAVAANSPYKSLRDLLKDAAVRPNTILYGANLGGNLHMVGLLLEGLEPGAKMRIVQIGAEADNVTAIKGGIINATTLSTGTYTRYREEGLKALASLADKREPTTQDLPTAREQGYDMSFCVQHWWWAPKGTPQSVVNVFAGALEKAMQDKVLLDFFEKRSILPTFDKGPPLKEKLDATYNIIAPVAVRAAKQ